MSEATPRQVLYALVAAGFTVVVLTLVVGAAVAGLVPGWWTGTMAVLVVSVAVVGSMRWRRTAFVLGLSIGLFVVWAVGTITIA